VRFVVLPETELEAAEAAIWYDDQRPGLGDDFLDELGRALDHIRRDPTESPRLESFIW